MRTPKGNRTAKEKLVDGLTRWPELRTATNNEIADALRIRHPMTVSHNVAALYHEGKIRISYGDGLNPIRKIELK